ncbi:MAG TPA: Maf family protein [Dermatophilaceae bacterium]|nr:Maf family protein [Dermatophilaceae bacterium]
MPISLVLASASPARLRLLRQSGADPEVVVSSVDEAAVLDAATRRSGALTAAGAALLLARAKCEDVAATLTATPGATRAPADLVLGCDSILDVDGQFVGKPATPDEAIRRWMHLSGRQATLLTGHWLIDLRGAKPLVGTGRPVRAGLGETAATTVRFAHLTEADIRDYVATGEPLRVAGGFTIDGLGGPFIDGVDGDPHNVVGLSLPLLRRLIERLGLRWGQLWHQRE